MIKYAIVPVEPSDKDAHRLGWVAARALGMQSPGESPCIIAGRVVHKAMLAASPPSDQVAVPAKLVERWEELLSGSNPLGWSDDIEHRIRWQSKATDLLDELRALSPTATGEGK